MNNLYRISVTPALVADGPALTSIIPDLVKTLTDMALADGHQTMQLKWQGIYAPPDVIHGIAAEYWLYARVLPMMSR